MVSGKGPNLDQAFPVDATGPIGCRISDDGSKSCCDENRPEWHLAKADKTTNSDQHHGAWRKQANDRQGFAGRHEKGGRNCESRILPNKIEEAMKLRRHE